MLPVFCRRANLIIDPYVLEDSFCRYLPFFYLNQSASQSTSPRSGCARHIVGYLSTQNPFLSNLYDWTQGASAENHENPIRKSLRYLSLKVRFFRKSYFSFLSSTVLHSRIYFSLILRYRGSAGRPAPPHVLRRNEYSFDPLFVLMIKHCFSVSTSPLFFFYIFSLVVAYFFSSTVH